VKTDAFFCGDSKLRTLTDLGYAVTGHKGMGGTVRSGTALVTGREPREWLYVAITRGIEDNAVVAVTHAGVKDTGLAKVAIQPKAADPRPGIQSDPELARRVRMERERAGLAGGMSRRTRHACGTGSPGREGTRRWRPGAVADCRKWARGGQTAASLASSTARGRGWQRRRSRRRK
jgi:hypothetical protein